MMAGMANAPMISSLSNTLHRILPASHQAVPSGQTHGGDMTSDQDSLSTDSSCSSCDSKCPSNEQEVFGQYRLVKTLGVGEFGKVKLGLHSETNQKVAIKVIKKKNAAAKLTKVEREIKVLKSLCHPHIVRLIEVVETDTHIGIILEYASGGELFEYVLLHRSLEENTARNLFAQLISSVNHMHEKGIAHRDLKLENLLFLDSQQTHLIVSDFGFANDDKKDLLSTCCGSPTYAAPELIYPSDGYHGDAADIWSCGVILYCMICGYLPFDDDPDNLEGANIHQLYRYIRSKSLSFPGFVSDDAQDLIHHMLQPNPANRCTLDFVINHPWLHSRLSVLSNKLPPVLEHQYEDVLQQRPQANKSSGDGLKRTHSQRNGYLHDQGHQLSTHYQQSEHLDRNQAKPYVIHEETDHVQNRSLPTPMSSPGTQHEAQHQSPYQHEDRPSSDRIPDLSMEGAYANQPMDTLPPTPMSLLASSKMSPGTDTNNTASSVLSVLNDKELPLLPPLPATPNNESDILNDSGTSERQRQPSLRRQKKFRPSLTIDAFSPITTTSAMANAKPARNTLYQQHIDVGDQQGNTGGTRPSLQAQDNSTRYYSTMLQGGNVSSEHTSFMNDIFSDENSSGNIVQHFKTASLPLLDKPPTLAIDSATSTTNLHDPLKCETHRPETRKQRNRLTSILSLTHPAPRRTQSVHIPSKKTSPSPVTTTAIGAPLTRKKTVGQTVKAWIHKKKPFTRRRRPSSSSSSSLSEPHLPASSANNDQQQAYAEDPSLNEQTDHRHLASSLDTMEQGMMRTLSDAQGNYLTSMAPSTLILTLVRIITALGIDVHHRSTFQLTCFRKSCHHHPFYHWQSKHTKDVSVTTAPVYGPAEVDQGHHVEFTVEICRSLMSDLYVVHMDLLTGDNMAFHFLRSKILTLMNLKA